jgi:hypothetical protein
MISDNTPQDVGRRLFDLNSNRPSVLSPLLARHFVSHAVEFCIHCACVLAVGKVQYFTKKMNEQIIEKVRQYEFLYNQHLRNYRDQNMRQEAWEEIGKELKISGKKKSPFKNQKTTTCCFRLVKFKKP